MFVRLVGFGFVAFLVLIYFRIIESRSINRRFLSPWTKRGRGFTPSFPHARHLFGENADLNMRIAVEMAMDTLDGPRAWSLSRTSVLDSLEEALWRFSFHRSAGDGPIRMVDGGTNE